MPTIKTTQISTAQRKADGLAIRYAESDAAGDETVLLLNPWPESLFAWETIWPRLAETGPAGRHRSAGLWQIRGPTRALLPTGHGDVPPQADR